MTANNLIEPIRTYIAANSVDALMAVAATSVIALLLSLFAALRPRVPGAFKREVITMRGAIARQQSYHERYVMDSMKVHRENESTVL